MNTRSSTSIRRLRCGGSCACACARGRRVTRAPPRCFGWRVALACRRHSCACSGSGARRRGPRGRVAVHVPHGRCGSRCTRRVTPCLVSRLGSAQAVGASGLAPPCAYAHARSGAPGGCAARPRDSTRIRARPGGRGPNTGGPPAEQGHAAPPGPRAPPPPPTLGRRVLRLQQCGVLDLPAAGPLRS